MSLWQFLEDQVLGMAWLNERMGRLVTLLGLNPESRWGGSLRFFLYDTVKILVLLGALIFLISLIQSYFPPERTKRILGRFHGLGANALAALLGTVTPFCSCSSIPLFLGFTSAGLPIGVTFSFLISSPMVDLGSLVLLMSIFGWRVALTYVGLGLCIAVAGGSLLQRWGMEDQVEPYVRSISPVDQPLEALTAGDRVRFAWDQVTFTVKKVLPYLLFGVGLGALIHNWIPQDLILRLLGERNPLGVPLAVLAGVPLYADIFGTIPISEALLMKGAQLGVVLAFMMAVTTLSIPSLVLLRKAVKPRLLGAFLVVCSLGIMVVGYGFNLLQNFLL